MSFAEENKGLMFATNANIKAMQDELSKCHRLKAMFLHGGDVLDKYLIKNPRVTLEKVNKRMVIASNKITSEKDKLIAISTTKIHSSLSEEQKTINDLIELKSNTYLTSDMIETITEAYEKARLKLVESQNLMQKLKNSNPILDAIDSELGIGNHEDINRLTNICGYYHNICIQYFGILTHHNAFK